MNAEQNNLQPNEQAVQLKGKQTRWSSYSILIYIIRCERTNLFQFQVIFMYFQCKLERTRIGQFHVSVFNNLKT